MSNKGYTENTSMDALLLEESNTLVVTLKVKLSNIYFFLTKWWVDEDKSDVVLSLNFENLKDTLWSKGIKKPKVKS